MTNPRNSKNPEGFPIHPEGVVACEANRSKSHLGAVPDNQLAISCKISVGERSRRALRSFGSRCPIPRLDKSHPSWTISRHKVSRDPQTKSFDFISPASCQLPSHHRTIDDSAMWQRSIVTPQRPQHQTNVQVTTLIAERSTGSIFSPPQTGVNRVATRMELHHQNLIRL